MPDSGIAMAPDRPANWVNLGMALAQQDCFAEDWRHCGAPVEVEAASGENVESFVSRLIGYCGRGIRTPRFAFVAQAGPRIQSKWAWSIRVRAACRLSISRGLGTIRISLVPGADAVETAAMAPARVGGAAAHRQDHPAARGAGLGRHHPVCPLRRILQGDGGQRSTAGATRVAATGWWFRRCRSRAFPRRSGTTIRLLSASDGRAACAWYRPCDRTGGYPVPERGCRPIRTMGRAIAGRRAQCRTGMGRQPGTPSRPASVDAACRAAPVMGCWWRQLRVAAKAIEGGRGRAVVARGHRQSRRGVCRFW